MNSLETLREIVPTLEENIREHDKTGDGLFYNGLSVASLLLSAFATVASQTNTDHLWIACASAATAVCVGVERALGFGARWRFHIEMKNAYRSLKEGVFFYNVLPPDRQPPFLNDWWSRLIALRNRESQIPGIK